MSKRRKPSYADWSTVENASKKRRQLVLRRSADDTFHCPVQECSHAGFQSKRGCRKHVNNLHPWFFYFENDPGPSKSGRWVLQNKHRKCKETVNNAHAYISYGLCYCLEFFSMANSNLWRWNLQITVISKSF